MSKEILKDILGLRKFDVEILFEYEEGEDQLKRMLVNCAFNIASEGRKSAHNCCEEKKILILSHRSR